MAKGLKKHLKRLKAPKNWKLEKLGGIWAPSPQSGPHKKMESFPIILILRNKLKYALNNREVLQILKKKNVKIDKKIRTEKNYPTGIMDVISLEKTNENFRLLYDTFGRFVLHRIEQKESFFKLCKIVKLTKGQRGIPYITTHDGRTCRFPDPFVKKNDTILFNLSEKKIIDFIKFDVGSLCLITGGNNIGRIGIVMQQEKNSGPAEMIRLKDSEGFEFFSKMSYIFVIGKGKKSFISLPKEKGLRKKTFF
ncbi:40S ribosomal protein S4 (nucleomorph) [Chroomonas mesostigmatica CCMP1168]|uniref:40S ribosomal protein S4 n=1 Tax=Chroomonas mesostigmatica CCMP1168 TaxID=1195612 RepID=J7G6B5_9CRYP|nr:40S ribosomal protein S4 [Chroomonas mesostigmatica CCMP1168]|mmetsp:Transcript_33134/g.81335  ORF Transcript_33134/g.81335 Transcript_33134/m.81335 type:complete len:251 (+) Transcript_33134:26-778(+)